MANMFSGMEEKRIPNSLAECTRCNETVTNLYSWAERLENWGEKLFVVLIIIGILSTIVNTVNIIEVDEDLVFVTAVTSIITWAIYAFIEYCTYHVLALLISALANITQNTIITANVALFDAAKKGDTQTYAEPSTVTNASTPNRAPVFRDAPSDSYAYNSLAPAGMWKCSHCGTNNKNDSGQCKKCGQFRT